jgi:hypothetical protein
VTSPAVCAGAHCSNRPTTTVRLSLYRGRVALEALAVLGRVPVCSPCSVELAAGEFVGLVSTDLGQ